MALPNIPPSVAPFTVVEYFPTPDVSGYHDPRHHAVSLAFVVPVAGDCQPTQEALDLDVVHPDRGGQRAGPPGDDRRPGPPHPPRPRPRRRPPLTLGPAPPAVGTGRTVRVPPAGRSPARVGPSRRRRTSLHQRLAAGTCDSDCDDADRRADSDGLSGGSRGGVVTDDRGSGRGRRGVGRRSGDRRDGQPGEGAPLARWERGERRRGGRARRRPGTVRRPRRRRRRRRRAGAPSSRRRASTSASSAAGAPARSSCSSIPTASGRCSPIVAPRRSSDAVDPSWLAGHRGAARAGLRAADAVGGRGARRGRSRRPRRRRRRSPSTSRPRRSSPPSDRPPCAR